MITTIQIEEKIKQKLDSLKIHHRETYNELIVRLIANCSSKNKQATRESLVATIEVLSDPETMRDIAKALEEYKRGEFVELK
jgi:FPC/CPF motif-containing protein YcgG